VEAVHSENYGKVDLLMENARLTFEHVVHDQVQEMTDDNFEFYTQITGDEDFSDHFIDWLF